MILHSAPANEAVLSNVGTVNSFTIKATAKSFRILSDGLYANKIRAIIRELSCNAYDSHVAAGKSDVPSEVHLPTTLEPWFAVRDFGLGLSAEQVTSIFTTFFESTKTGSNDFVGALGLGSKSPFSYTDNFTVTAVQDGQRGVYTAFINDEGVPSIAVMSQGLTTEPNGVEVRFSVDNPRDFNRFADEAGQVFVYFATQPVCKGQPFRCDAIEYEVRDIIPGVHQAKRMYRQGTSVAVMGNISYPINIPGSQGISEDLINLLSCNLEMHFDIGELDFQASREGLSYVPQTITAIVDRLRATTQALTVQLAAEADAIPNLWDRAVFLGQRRDSALWKPAVLLYAAQNPIPTFNSGAGHYHSAVNFEFTEQCLAADYNIRITTLERKVQWSGTTVRRMRAKDRWDNQTPTTTWLITVDEFSHIVVNDSRKGAAERARYHYAQAQPGNKSFQIYVLQRANNELPMQVDQFLAAIHNPPQNRVVDASTLESKPAAARARTLSIVQLIRSDNRRNRGELVWSDPVKIDTSDTTSTFYYIPLKHYQLISQRDYQHIETLYNEAALVCDIAKLGLYGVRKTELENIQQLSNWVNIEDHIAAQLTPDVVQRLVMSRVHTRVIDYNVLSLMHMEQIIARIANSHSLYVQVARQFLKVQKNHNAERVSPMLKRYLGDQTPNVDALVTQIQSQLDQLARRYPMLTIVQGYSAGTDLIADYINMMDRTAAMTQTPSKTQVADLV